MSSFNYLEMSYFPALATLDNPVSWRGQSDDHIDEWQGTEAPGGYQAIK